MSYIDTPSVHSGYTFTSRLDDGHLPGREVYRATAPDGRETVMVIHDLGAGRYPLDRGDSDTPETVLLSRCDSHPALPHITGSGLMAEDRGLAYIELEPFEGVTLEDYVAQHGPIPEAQAVDILTDIASALAQISIVTDGGGHYNLHPGNILIRLDTDSNGNPTPAVMLTGMVHAGHPYNGKTPFRRSELRQSYRAPETYRGIFGHTSDQFSLGLVAGFMLTGHHPWNITDEPFKSIDDALLHMQVIKPELRKFTFLPPAWQKVLGKITEYNRIRRYRTPGDMAYAIRTLAEPGMDDTGETSGNPEHKSSGGQAPQTRPVTSRGAVKNTPASAATMTRGGGTLDDVAGMEALKATLRRNFVDILRNREMAAQYDITPPNGILLYGAPGCGKTFIAEKAAQESGLNYKVVNPGDLGSIYIHGSQEKIANLFEQAKRQAPTILILDEFDAIAPSRSGGNGGEAHHQAGEVNELLTRLNNCASTGVYVIAMTNRPDMVDKAMLRKGRIDDMYYVPLPDRSARKGIFSLELRNRPVDSDVDPGVLADLTENYTCSDITYIVKETARDCFSRTIRMGSEVPTPLTASDLSEMVSRTPPSVTQADIRYYNRLAKRFASSADRDSFPPAGFNIESPQKT